MLVKFLSFVVSVFGTARYKTVLLSCLALILSLTGITTLVIRGSGSNQNASSTVQQQKDGVDTQSFTPQLRNSRQQVAKNQPAPTAQPDNSSSSTKNSDQADDSSTTNTNTSTSAKPPTTTTVDVTLNTTTMSVAAGSSSDLITATTTDNSSVNWSAIVDGGDANGHVTFAQTTGATTSLQIQAGQNLPSGTTFKVSIFARDATRNLTITKQVTVTIE
jgi:hypothetical protein